MSNNAPTFDNSGIVGDQGSSSSGGSYSPSVADVPEGVAQLVFDAIKQQGGANQCIELPAFADDAPDLDPEYQDHYGLDGVETMSVEGLFGQDWSNYDYVGTIPLTQSEDLTEDQLDQLTDAEKFKSNGDLKKYVPDPDHAEAFRDANAHEGAITPISKGINGHHAEAVAEQFGENTAISVGKGKDRNHGGDPVEARKFVSFQVSGSENAAFNRMKAAKEAGNLDPEDFQDWASANGYEDQLD